jgi:DNA mismatch repair protein PMS2
MCNKHSIQGSTQTVLSTQSSSKLSDNICSVFGSKFFLTTVHITVPLRVSKTESQTEVQTADDADEAVFGTIDGYISRVGEGVGRSDNDRQFIFCNNRPVDVPKISKIINEVCFAYFAQIKITHFCRFGGSMR